MSDLCSDNLRHDAVCQAATEPQAKWYTLSGVWRISEDAAVGMAQKFAADVSEHPLKAAGELALGVVTVGAAVASAPEIAAASAALATAAGLGQAGAEVVGGLAAAGWLTIPFVGGAQSATNGTVAGLENSREDRTVLMHPELYPPDRVASADESVRRTLGPPALTTLEVAGGVLGTAYFGGSVRPQAYGRRQSEAPGSADDAVRAPEGKGRFNRADGNDSGRSGKTDACSLVHNPAFDQAVHAAQTYLQLMKEQLAANHVQTREEARALNLAKHDYDNAVDQLRGQYGFGMMSPEALAILARTAGNRLTVDFGAGNGYAASLMQQMGMNVKAIDVAPVGQTPNEYWYTSAAGNKPAQFLAWTHVEQGNVDALRTVPQDSVLFMSWPPADGSSAAALNNYGGNTVVVLTETGGSTGTTAFWRTLQDKYNLQTRVPISPMTTAAGQSSLEGNGLRFDFSNRQNDPGLQEMLIYQRRQ